MKLAPLLMIVVVTLAILCAPAIAEPTSYVQKVSTSNTIINATTQSDLIELVVFAFTIGIIMMVLGFAMAFFFIRRR